MRRLIFALAIAAASLGAAPAFDPKPWLEDFDQVHDAITTRYANFEWAVFDRETDLPSLFAETRLRIANASDDGDARAAFDRFLRRLGDGHMEFHWPRTQAAPAGAGPPLSRCAALGYDSKYLPALVAANMPGYRALSGGPEEFPAGLIEVAGREVGVIKVSMFATEAWPSLCDAVLVALALPAVKPCDDACSERVWQWTHARLTGDFARQLRALKAAGAAVLLVDIAGNGGGSEWNQAALRMVTARRIVSNAGGFVRGAHWEKIFAVEEAELRDAARSAQPQDRQFLLHLADQVEARRLTAATPCDGSPLWRRERPACAFLGTGFYTSRMLASADPTLLRGKPWAATVFSPMEFPYEEGVWSGPLIVLIDRGTALAASSFASNLQDNHAAILLGEPCTSGGGHTDGGTPVTLNNSKGVFVMPDSTGFRADGSNEARGIDPDVLIGFQPGEALRLKAARVLAALPVAIGLARNESGRN